MPDQLVHNIMPIFTFMGANVLQRDDAYSLRVVEQVRAFSAWDQGLGLTWLPAIDAGEHLACARKVDEEVDREPRHARARFVPLFILKMC